MSSFVAGVLSLAGIFFIFWLFVLAICTVIYGFRVATIQTNSPEIRSALKSSYRYDTLVKPTKFFWSLILMCFMLVGVSMIRESS